MSFVVGLLILLSQLSFGWVWADRIVGRPDRKRILAWCVIVIAAALTLAPDDQPWSRITIIGPIAAIALWLVIARRQEPSENSSWLRTALLLAALASLSALPGLIVAAVSN